MQKCGCKSSKCLTLRCGCKKNGGYCSSLCQCINCVNTEHSKKNQSEEMSPQPNLFMDENEDDELNTTTSGSETDEAVESDVDMEDDI